MPVYNTPLELLEAAVKSIGSQTYENWELLIIDDGSERICSDLCDRLAEEDKRVKVSHIENTGVSGARNTGINKSSGEYVAFIDSDDTMARNALEVMVEQIADVDFVAIGCEHVRSITESGEAMFNGEYTADQNGCIEFLCYQNPLYSHIETNAVWGKLYRGEIIDRIRFDESLVMAEDFLFNLEYINNTQIGKYLDFKGYNYLERGESISRKYNGRMMNTIDVIEKITKDYEKTSVFDALISRCVNIAFTILMMVPNSFKLEKKRTERFISKYRVKVLLNKHIKKKLMIAIITSFCGYWLTCNIYELLKGNEKK